MKKLKLILATTILLALIIFLLSDSPLNFFSEEVANDLDTTNKPYNKWNEEDSQKYLEENFIQDEDGFYSLK